jgi:benzoyl-CoA reductase/2-hydroxyglutaryl-CoA dehydratase subunit BcrC/BadD/HgdB
MKTLSETWFADGYIDFELKKYILLAYLQEIGRQFGENKLYPQLADLIFHYNNLVAFRENKKHLQEHFPKKLSGIQMEKLQLLYEQMVEDDELMQELEAIIEYAGNRMQKTISSGTEIYEFVEEHLTITPIGLLPIESKEGYFFLSDGTYREIKIFQFRLSIFERHQEKYRSIKTEMIGQYQRNIVNTYELIKIELIRQRKDLPNPAVYSIETALNYPMEETLLPIAKRSLVRYISSAAA